MTRHRSLCAVFSLAVAALATPLLPASAGAQTGHAGHEQPQSRDRNRLTEEEIKNSAQANRDMLEVVRSTRPQWLRSRGDRSVSNNGSLKVYVDGMMAGGIAELQQLDPQRVKSAQFLSASAATTQFGTDHGRGAILIATR